MGKIIIADVGSVFIPTHITDSKLWHGDYGCQLIINGLDLSTGTQVHFSLSEKSGEPIPMMGINEDGIFRVDIPDNILRQVKKKADYPLYAFVYSTDESSGWTVHEIVIPVGMRPGTESFQEPSEEQQGTFDSITQQIKKNTEDIEELKEKGLGEKYTLPKATSETLGGVKADLKTESDTVPVRIGEDEKLYVPKYPDTFYVEADSALDKTSTNPVQNKVVTTEFERLANEKADNDKIPTKTSNLQNDSGFIDKATTDLLNYYLKSETYSKKEVMELISLIPKFAIKPVDTLPTTDISATTVYLLKSGEESNNLYTEYIYVDGAWEYLGTQTVDLTGYATEQFVKDSVAEIGGVEITSDNPTKENTVLTVNPDAEEVNIYTAEEIDSMFDSFLNGSEVAW